MAGERLILVVDRVLKSRTFWRWAGVAIGIAGLTAAGFLVGDADQPGVDPGSRNAEIQAAGLVGLVSLAMVGVGVWAWVGGRQDQAGTGSGSRVERPDADRGAEHDNGG